MIIIKEKRYMKVIEIVLLLVSVLLFTGGCSSKDKKDEKKDVDSKEISFEIKNKDNVEDIDSNGKISVGDKITLKTESFYVISINEEDGTVKMFSEWNLNVGDNKVKGGEGIQNEKCKGWTTNDKKYNCTVTFSSTNYWGVVDLSKPTWVYNEKSNLYPYVQEYETYLKDKGYGSVCASIISVEELEALGCNLEGYTCEGGPKWLKNTSFWTGSVSSYTDVWLLPSSGYIGMNEYSLDKEIGVRPVITISVLDI